MDKMPPPSSSPSSSPKNGTAPEPFAAATEPADKVHVKVPTSPPQPQSPPTAQVPPQAQRQKKPDKSPPRSAPPPPLNGKSFYGYLFNHDKTATDLLDALLRAVANHVALNIGDKNATTLDPKKLAAFYHEVGGDYDTLFLNAPNESISYIWRALGVQHILQQPADNFYVEPSIPALTPQGFVRWETIQILLEPQEHVPFIQYAARHWALKHPETGEPFPADLPKEAFPAECDPQIDKWHKSCAERLRREAAMQEETATPQPPPPRDPRVHAGFSHVPGPQVNPHPHRRRAEMDYFSRERPTVYTRVPPPTRHPHSHHSSPYSPERRRGYSSSSDEPRRRRSFNDLKRSPEHNVRFTEHLSPRPPPTPRRHSQPRHHSAPSSSSSESDSDVPHSRTPSASRLYSHVPPTQPPSVRRTKASPGPPPQAVPLRPRRSDVPPEDPRRRSLTAEVKHKLASLLPGSHERHRSSSREHNGISGGGGGGGGGGVSVRPRYTRETPSFRRSHGWSDGSYPDPDDDSDSDSGISPKQRDRQGRERERARRLDREREREREERDRRSRRDKGYLRPMAAAAAAAPDGRPDGRRPSSHADAERRAREYAWERERGRGSDYERSGGGGGGGGRRVATSGEREPRAERSGGRRPAFRERDPSPPIITGVNRRRYASATATAAPEAPWN